MDIRELNITKKQAKALEAKGVYTIEDFVRLLPRKYFDFRTPRQLATITDGEVCSIVGTVRNVQIGKNFIRLTMREREDYALLEVVWFNQMYLGEELEFLNGKEIVVCGAVTTNSYNNEKRIINPMICSERLSDGLRIYPVYTKIKGIADRTYLSLVEQAIAIEENNETVPEEVLDHFRLPHIHVMLRFIHTPKTTEEIRIAKKRLVFEELYLFSKVLESNKQNACAQTSIRVQTDALCQNFIQSLPYELTVDQASSIEQLLQKAKAGERINALVQGDVGYGKTIVAFILMMALVENGYQAVLMAPTGILASQHYNELCSYVEPLGYKVAFLTGSLKVSESKKIKKGIENGEYQFIIGTHSVVSSSVVYKNLGITVVDEEHKFGVAQREALTEKALNGVHSITMSATPIPRSLALSIYGEGMTIYDIKTRPKGRQPVQTAVNNSLTTIYEFMMKEIRLGHQCYMVCPLISDSDNEKVKDVTTVESAYEHVSNYFLRYPEVSIGALTGKMKNTEIDEQIQKFKNNEIQILISTTIVEVGVSIPNATVIVIRNAERFGLAGMHQLRGRVGRGAGKAYCILQSAEKNNPRLTTMCQTSNGFEIAEADLKIRGSGDFIGTKQSGENKQVMLMLAYPNMYKIIRQYVSKQMKGENASETSIFQA